jgi:hypothetical protein
MEQVDLFGAPAKESGPPVFPGVGLRLVPVKREAAFAWIADVHRHLPPPVMDIIRVGVARDEALVGVGCAGRPVSRHLDDGLTLEVVRVAVLDAQPHACSMIYGALARAAKALGYARILTYTREDEPGTSLRAAGWACDGAAGGGEWSCASRPRAASVQPIRKVRWSKVLC